jgi:hypothetical protein
MDGRLSEHEFQANFAIGELSVLEYIEFEKQCFRKFREEGL